MRCWATASTTSRAWFSSGEQSPAPSGAPRLDGVVAWIDCALHGEFPGGDHTIVVGAVRGLEHDEPGPDGDDPLLWFGRGYRRLAP